MTGCSCSGTRTRCRRSSCARRTCRGSGRRRSRRRCRWLRTHVRRSLTPYDPAKRREMRGHDPDVLIMGYSKLRGWGDHLAGKVRTVIFDEAQELRRAESAEVHRRRADRRPGRLPVGLTATPVYNYGGEIHNVMSVLAPDALGPRGVRARVVRRPWSDKAQVLDPAALGVHLRDQGLMLRRTRREVGRELPPASRDPALDRHRRRRVRAARRRRRRARRADRRPSNARSRSCGARAASSTGSSARRPASRKHRTSRSS
jgi:superfamily II DNA or RNA helicase